MSLNYATRAIAQITNAPGTAGTSFVVSTGQGARFVSGAQERRCRIYNASTGAVEEGTITNRSTDTFTVTRNADAGGALDVTASGWVIEDIDDLGPWIALAYDASFFASAGGGTFGVDSADVIGHAWRRVGYTVNYRCRIAAFSITGTVTELRVLFPVAAMPAGPKYAEGSYPIVIFDNSGTVATLGFAYWAAGDPYITIKKFDSSAFAVSTNASYLAFNFPIEIA